MSKAAIEDVEGALGDLDKAYRGPLMKFFYRRVGNYAEAEDLTQDLFVRLVGRKGAEPIDHVEHFIFRAAANLLRDRARRATTSHGSQHIAIPEGSNADGECPLPTALVEDRAPDRVLMGKERLGEVLDRLDELGERTRTIFILFRIERMKQREIARRLGIAVPTVEKHVIRAVAHLTRCFGSECW